MNRLVCTGLRIAARGAIALALCTGVFEAQGGQRAAAQTVTPPSIGDLEVIQLRPNFYMIAGAGGNIAVQIGEDGIVVVDAGLAPSARKLSRGTDVLTSMPCELA